MEDDPEPGSPLQEKNAQVDYGVFFVTIF